MANILIVSPHPDDEAIGCAGMISHHVKEGDTVKCIYLTNGERGIPSLLNGVYSDIKQGLAEAADIRRVEAIKCSALLSTQCGFFDLPDGHVKSGLKAVLMMRDQIDAFGPSIIYVTHDYESHQDHKAAYRIVRKATLGQTNIEIRLYEVWTPIQRPNLVVDITSVLGIKLSAIRIHESQVKLIRFEDAALALNRFRGELYNQPTGGYAEAFRVIMATG